MYGYCTLYNTLPLSIEISQQHSYCQLRPYVLPGQLHRRSNNAENKWTAFGPISS